MIDNVICFFLGCGFGAFSIIFLTVLGSDIADRKKESPTKEEWNEWRDE